MALAESTEAEQFTEKKALTRSERGPDAACQPILGDCPHTPVKIDVRSGRDAAAVRRLSDRSHSREPAPPLAADADRAPHIAHGLAERTLGFRKFVQSKKPRITSRGECDVFDDDRIWHMLTPVVE